MIDSAFLDFLERTAIAAGAEILLVRQSGAVVSYKSDATPVTGADERAEALILAALAERYPDIPVVAEEQTSAGHCPDCGAGRFFLVDALDGTKDFIQGRDEFTVNIALIDGEVPVAGVVHAPAMRRTWRGGPDGADTAEIGPDGSIIGRVRIRTRPMPARPTAVKSFSHSETDTETFLAGIPEHDTAVIGSSLKFCIVAEGKADIYPRLVNLMQWDTAAGDAVLRAAGGVTLTPEGGPVLYGQRDGSYANSRFVSLGCSEVPDWMPSGR
ncbi:3'(2'),5'-bisphosphate nucleotidase [Hoeflea marina]|uniref:3'(2'),5'-bisphosphate nucleotidase CysQ n=2 Tax=Hoeflea marina TaxID=274592 RepID=A0A317PRD2_9HYPH|nr:3'(2'),5'-bisphosphate nucleotidase [Hoeflea marina]